MVPIKNGKIACIAVNWQNSVPAILPLTGSISTALLLTLTRILIQILLTDLFSMLCILVFVFSLFRIL